MRGLLIRKCVLGAAAAALVGAGCGDHDDDHDHDAGTVGAGDGDATVAQTLFATEGQTIVAFDISTGSAHAGAIANVKGPVDMQALESGHVLVNLTDNNEVLILDARKFREVIRIPSSGMGATRPVHSFVTPKIAGKQYWVANNDGSGTAATSSAVFIDIVPGSATFLKPVGEIGLGVGHHKDAWSPGETRVSISNIADCSNVLQVIDYSDAAKPTLIKKWSAAELDPVRDCATQGASPHGGAAASNGRGYHNLAGWGVIAAIDQTADAPTVKLLPTKGNGAGYTKAGKDGRYVYSLQRTPRQGDATRPGADCQIGQLVAVDSTTDNIAAEIPILLTGSNCTAKLPAYATAAGPDHSKISADGKTLFITTQAAPPVGSTDVAYSDQLVVFDLSNPAIPAQKTSISVGKHSGHRAMTLSGDGKILFVVNNGDKTISQIDVPAMSVTRTITLMGSPSQMATWGSEQGPSVQTGPR